MANPESSSTSGVASGRFPGSVTFLSVMALVLASLGVIGSGFGLLSLLSQRQTMESMRAMGASNPDPRAAEMFEPMIALQQRILLPSAAMYALLGLAAVLLAAAGILVLIRHARVPVVGPALLGASGVLSMLGTVIELWIQHASMDAMGGMMAGVMSEAPPDASASTMMEQMMGLMGALTYGCVGGWLLLKITFLVWAALHLRSKEIAGLFGGPRIPGIRGD
jgi:hypothetical protein